MTCANGATRITVWLTCRGWLVESGIVAGVSGKVIGIRGGAIGMGTLVVIGGRNTMETNSWGHAWPYHRYGYGSW